MNASSDSHEIEFPDGELFVSEQIERIIELTAKIGFKCHLSADSLVAQPSGLTRPIFLPLAELGKLELQLQNEPKPLNDHFGFSGAANYFEMILRSPRAGPPERFLTGLETAPTACQHIDGAELISLADPERYLPYSSRSEANILTPIHVTSPQKGTCIEISFASPCGILFGPPSLSSRFRPNISLKIDHMTDVPHSTSVDDNLRIANSFLYELAVRNGVVLEPISRSAYKRSASHIRPERTNGVRFPSTHIEHEVAELFAFAEAAGGNLPLAYLSFYQVLEYYFPYAIRRKTLTRVKKELADPRFHASESELLRVISIAESGAQANEREQIATLLSETVREDRLQKFFADADDSKHFHKIGPISGVEAISHNNHTKPISQQVATRVYNIRNRIVHAKDDPKFSNVRVLLPRGREATSLGPDVELIRLLAIDVITDAQLHAPRAR